MRFRYQARILSCRVYVSVLDPSLHLIWYDSKCLRGCFVFIHLFVYFVVVFYGVLFSVFLLFFSFLWEGGRFFLTRFDYIVQSSYLNKGVKHSLQRGTDVFFLFIVFVFKLVVVSFSSYLFVPFSWIFSLWNFPKFPVCYLN